MLTDEEKEAEAAMPTPATPAPRERSKPDGRRRIARLVAGVARDLRRALGHAPSPLEALLVDLAAHRAIHLRLLDAQIAIAGDLLPEHAALYAEAGAQLLAALKALRLAHVETVAGMSFRTPALEA